MFRPQPKPINDLTASLRQQFGETMSTRQVADCLGVSRYTVRAIDDDALPKMRQRGRAGFRYPVTNVARYIRAITEGGRPYGLADADSSASLAPVFDGRMPDPVPVTCFALCLDLYQADGASERGMAAVLEHLHRCNQTKHAHSIYARLTALQSAVGTLASMPADAPASSDTLRENDSLVAAAAVGAMFLMADGSFRFDLDVLVQTAQALAPLPTPAAVATDKPVSSEV